jgi:prevent-host-death family protein
MVKPSIRCAGLRNCLIVLPHFINLERRNAHLIHMKLAANLMRGIMMINLKNIRSLTDFQRNTKDYVRRLKETGLPEVLTVNGEAEVVVQSAAAYQKLLDDLQLLDALKGIQRGLDEAKRGAGRPMREFLREIAAKRGIQLPE